MVCLIKQRNLIRTLSLHSKWWGNSRAIDEGDITLGDDYNRSTFWKYFGNDEFDWCTNYRST